MSTNSEGEVTDDNVTISNLDGNMDNEISEDNSDTFLDRIREYSINYQQLTALSEIVEYFGVLFLVLSMIMLIATFLVAGITGITPLAILCARMVLAFIGSGISAFAMGWLIEGCIEYMRESR